MPRIFFMKETILFPESVFKFVIIFVKRKKNSFKGAFGKMCQNLSRLGLLGGVRIRFDIT